MRAAAVIIEARAAAVAALLALAGCSDNSCTNCGPPLPVPEVSLGLVAGDFTHNGETSLIATSTILYYPTYNPGNLKSYLSTGPGAFASPVLTADGYGPLYLASADFNGDKLPDVVSASFADGALAIFLNNPQSPGTLNPPIVLASPGASQVAVGDLNGDGLPDLVSADFYVSLFLQTSPGTFASPIGLYPGGANWVAVGDLNGDGIPDVALTDAVGVKVLMHVGPAASPTYAAPVPVFTQTPNANLAGANLIAIADVNGDGLNDLVITDPGPTGGSAPTVSILLQNAAHHGEFLPPVAYPVAPNSLAQSIVLTPLVPSLLLLSAPSDIVIGGTAAVSVLLHDPSKPGAFLPATNYSVAYANEIAVADVNADNYPDILVGTGPNAVTVNAVITNTPGVLLQNPAMPGTFGTVQSLP